MRQHPPNPLGGPPSAPGPLDPPDPPDAQGNPDAPDDQDPAESQAPAAEGRAAGGRAAEDALPRLPLELSHVLWAVAGLVGMIVTALLLVTDRFDHRSGTVEVLVSVLLGVMTMAAFAPWRAIFAGSRQRREIRHLSDQVRRAGTLEPLRSLLESGDGEMRRLRRAIHDRLSEATAHRVEAGHLRRTMTDAIRRETGRATGRLRKEVHTDVLTGIGNRRALAEQMVRMLDEATQRRHRLTALIIDVDRFKAINDRLGHAVGDECLSFLGRTLAEGIRGEDRAFRIGGDEFVVLMPRVGVETAVQVGRRLGKLYSQMAWKYAAAPRPTLSMGVACVRPGEIEDPQELIQRADRAMYASKREGRARITTYRDLRGAA